MGTNTSIHFGIEVITSPWIPISKIPSSGSSEQDKLNDLYGRSGVYQVALSEDISDIGDSIVHSKIGYTGKSKDILTRTYDIRQPAGSHGAGRYIRQNGYNKETEVKIRYLYTSPEDYANLEKEIHDQSLSKYGYRFAWTDASAGNDGTYSQLLELSKKLTVDEIFDIIPVLKQLAIKKNAENFLERLNEL